jgi:putative tricarboxylic transport membrane protein
MPTMIDAYRIARISDKIFPLTIGGVTLLVCFALLWRMRRRPDVFIDFETEARIHGRRTACGSTLAWFVGLLILTGLFLFDGDGSLIMHIQEL